MRGRKNQDEIRHARRDTRVDRREKLFSLPSRLGAPTALWIARLAHASSIVALVALGFVAGLGWLYAGGVAIAALLLAIENSLVRPGDYSKVNIAFFTLNGVVSVVLATMAIADMLL